VRELVKIAARGQPLASFLEDVAPKFLKVSAAQAEEVAELLGQVETRQALESTRSYAQFVRKG